MSESKFNIQAKIKKLEAAKVELPRLLANVGQTYFQESFRKQEYDGKKWDPRKEGTYYAKKMAGKAILVGKTGDLLRAMGNTIASFDWSKIVWAVKDVSYASYVHYGTDNMPARPIMGITTGLLEKVTKKIVSEFDKVMSHEKS